MSANKFPDSVYFCVALHRTDRDASNGGCPDGTKMTRFKLDCDAMAQTNFKILTRNDLLHNSCIRDFNATDLESIQPCFGYSGQIVDSDFCTTYKSSVITNELTQNSCRHTYVKTSHLSLSNKACHDAETPHDWRGDDQVGQKHRLDSLEWPHFLIQIQYCIFKPK